MMEKRQLTSQENKKLRKLNLSPNAEQSVREVWATEKYKKSNPLSNLWYLLTPAMIVLLCFSAFQPEHLVVKFENLVVLIVWVINIIVLPLAMVCIFIAFALEKANPLGHFAMKFVSNKPVGKFYGITTNLALVAMLAISNHLPTAIFLLLAWASILFLRALVKNHVQETLKKAEAV